MEHIFLQIKQKISRLNPDQKLIDNIKNQLLISRANNKNYRSLLANLSEIDKGSLSLLGDYVNIDLPQTPEQLAFILNKLKPWRKGPYKLGKLLLESEWQGGLKWRRLAPHITSLIGRNVLDVGCGNGYFSYQISLSGANFVLGLEPTQLSYHQFYALESLIKKPANIVVLPIRLKQLAIKAKFDSVFSMGVLYHQKSPINHLLQLKKQLKPDGELVLETLIVDGGLGYALLPKSRYAQMPNVWFLPSIATMEQYLARCGFSNIRCVNINQTTTLEQRRTKWLGDNKPSLADFLDPNDTDKTTEGYPAPKRAIFIANLDV